MLRSMDTMISKTLMTSPFARSYDAVMGERIDFWALLARPRRSVESWRYLPADGMPARVSIGRLTDDPTGTWFVAVFHPTVPSLVCADEEAARAARHEVGVELMRACGPGRWERAEI